MMRDYQQQAVTSVLRELNRVRSTLLVMATGTGKTIVFTHIAADWRGRVLILAHRSELIDQAASKVCSLCQRPFAVEKGEQWADEQAQVVLGSVQSIHKEKRLERFPRDHFGLVVIDEAHHAPANTYRRILDHFAPAAKVLGVTATPKRHDQRAMGEIFESVAYDFGIRPAVDAGWLVPIHQQIVKVDGLDFSRVRNLGGDFNEAELEQILIEEETLHKVAAPTIDLAGNRPTMVFCVTVKHAKLMAAVLCRYRDGCAFALDGETDEEIRKARIADFKAGKLPFLCNVNLFLEGFDAPNTACIAMARPTQSLPLYTQVLGRGTRPLPGVVDGLDGPLARRMAILNSVKPDMLVLDYAGNAGRHKIVDAQDVLGGKYSDEVRQYARKNQEDEGKPVNVDEAMERAEIEMALEEEELERRAAIKAKAEFKTQAVSVFGGRQPQAQTTHEPIAKPKPSGGNLASDKQVAFLVHLGVPLTKARSMSRGQAGVVIDSLRKKQQARQS